MVSKGLFKVVFLGHSQSGKTSLIHNCLFKNENSRNAYVSTIEDSYICSFTNELTGKDLKLILLDTAGSEKFSPNDLKRYIQTSDAFVLMHNPHISSSVIELNRLTVEIQTRSAPFVVIESCRDVDSVLQLFSQLFLSSSLQKSYSSASNFVMPKKAKVNL